ncbi:MAG TPA: hypothetical protein PKA27_02230 [Fimbriimonadaceae bacterium]|nr:hypothetical protein [Fimbriimonadaceae bacterium]
MKFTTVSLSILALTTFAKADLLHSYQFHGNLEPSVGVFPLLPKEGLANPIGFSPTYSSATVGSTTKQVVNFSFNQGFLARFGMVPEPGLDYGNQYTILWDIKVDALQDGRWLSFYNTNKSNSNDGDMFLDLTRGFGISGDYAGIAGYALGQWHRIVLVVDLFRAGTTDDPRMSIYVDGNLANQVPLGAGLDGRWALYTERLLEGDEFQGTYLLMDESGESASGQLSQVAFWNESLEASEVAALGLVGSAVGPNSVGFDAVDVLEGEIFDGGLESIASSDDNVLALFNDPTTLAGSLKLSANIGIGSASSLAAVVETSAARPGLQESIAFRNQTNGNWEVKGGRVATPYDWFFKSGAGSASALYVAANGTVEVRLTWNPINDEDPATDGWLMSLDAARLEFTP